MDPVSIVVMASGRGSNFQAVVKAIENGTIQSGKIVALITDRVNTGAEEFARSRSIPVHILPYREFPGRADFDAALDLVLSELSPGLILTLGYMRIIKADTVESYKGRIINIHPSLLPSFPGMHAQRQAWQYGVRVSGATVHFMDEGVDTGPIIMQGCVTLPAEGDEDAVADAILQVEHRILPEAVDLFCRGKILLEGRNVKFL